MLPERQLAINEEKKEKKMASLTSYATGGAMEQVGRNLTFINIAKGSAVTAADTKTYAQAVSQIGTVTVIGALGANSVNMIVEGLVDDGSDAYKSAGQDTYDNTYLEKLSELTGLTVTAHSF